MGKGILHMTPLQSRLSANRDSKKVRDLKLSQDSHVEPWLLSVNSLSLLSLYRHAITHSLASKVGFGY